MSSSLSERRANEWKSIQSRLNAFTKKYLRHVTPLKVDGNPGKLTRIRIESVKFYIGYGRTRKANSGAWTPKLDRALKSPKGRFLPRRVRAAGASRRARQRAAARASAGVGHAVPGLAVFEGKTVAKCAICHLRWARKQGWRGGVNSGWRSIPYSISLCYRMCGRPSCPGRCAGAGTNHVGRSCARFAIDVSDYGTFGRLMRSCPCSPRIFNALGARDPVHFSPSGR